MRIVEELVETFKRGVSGLCESAGSSIPPKPKQPLTETTANKKNKNNLIIMD